MDYDTYASKSPLQKVQILATLSPENKAELVITHWRRFLQANRARLNAEQVEFIEENIAYVRPEDYKLPRDEKAIRKRGEETEKRAREIFSLEDLVKFHMEAFKNSGEIPNPVARSLAISKIEVQEHQIEILEKALHDLATIPPDQLRSRRYGDDDLETLLRRHYPDLAENFWDLLADEDVPLAALRGRALIKLRAKRGNAAPPPPPPPC